MTASDSIFYTLSKGIQRRIDEAFGETLDFSTIQTPSISGGGFFLEHSPEPSSDTPIPLTLIPAALQRLGLPSDDDQVLSVFRNAASGWNFGSLTDQRERNDANSTLNVSREDWRSVCAVLLEDNESNDEFNHSSRNPGSGEDEGGDDSDIYHESPDTSQEDTDDDFEPFPRTRRSRGTAKAAVSSAPPDSASPSKLTASQQRVCLDSFALFFPDVLAEDLPKQKLMIKDIQQASKLLNEKLKSQEIIEMLEMFSTSPDKTMDFNDFSRMMDVAHLI